MKPATLLNVTLLHGLQITTNIVMLQIMSYAFMACEVSEKLSSESAFKCSKLTIEAIEQDVKYVQS